MQGFSSLPVRYLSGCAVVTLPAEIDLVNVPDVRDTLLAVLNRGAGGVVADMTGTVFCDAAGARALVRASGRAEALGTWLRVVITHPGPRKVLALTGADNLVPVFPDLAAALGTRDARCRPAQP
jgi:anti-anti-sigma factor